MAAIKQSNKEKSTGKNFAAKFKVKKKPT